MIKLIFYYQSETRENDLLPYFFENGRKQLRDESKNNRFFSLQKQKKIGENNLWETDI